MSEDGARRAAHRPSRRDDIIRAAVKVFADRGYAEASVNDVAAAAQVVVSGIYYHFEGKAQLFDLAIAEVYESLDGAIEASRVGHEPGSAEALRSAIRAGQRWVDDHPHGSKMLYNQLPGATPGSARLREQHESKHVATAYQYLQMSARSPDVVGPASELVARTLVHLIISVMPLRLEEGLLGRRSRRSLEASLMAVCHQIVFG